MVGQPLRPWVVLQRAGWREGSACCVVSAGAALQQAAHIPADSTQPSSEEGRWLLESAQKAEIERGLVCTGTNAVVVLGITKRHLYNNCIIKTGNKSSILEMEA